MVSTKNRHIHDFDFDIESYQKLKHKYEPSNICEMPVKWHKAKDFNLYDDKGNKWIDFSSTIFLANAGHGNSKIINSIKKIKR